MTDETPSPPRRPRRRTKPGTTPDAVDTGAIDDAPTEAVAIDAASPAAPSEPVAVRTPAEAAAFSREELSAPAALRVERGALTGVTATEVDLRIGGIGMLDAQEVFVQWGGVGAARAERLEVGLGSVGAVLAGEAKVTQGIAGSIVARDVVLEQSFVRTLFAQRVTAVRPTGVLVMIAQQVSGDIRPLLDWKGAIAAGAALGLVTAVARLVRDRN